MAVIVLLIGVFAIYYTLPAKSVYAGFQTTVTQTEVQPTTAFRTETQVIVSVSTIPQATITQTSTLITPSISTIITTVTSAVATTTTTQVTTTTATSFQTFPPTVTVGGGVSTVAPLSTPISMDFVSGSTSITAIVTNGHYSVYLPNHQTYHVIIHYSINPIGGGQCDAGILVLNAVDNLAQGWSC